MKVLDGLQLAYKVTANDEYGQMGPKTSSIAFKKIASCTTAIGRKRIYDASRLVKEWATIQNPPMIEPDVIYGDTDSIFVKFDRSYNGQVFKGHEALKKTIEWGQQSGDYITKQLHKELKKPQVLEYEKTFFPFILISKKRYTGEKYEFKAENPSRTSMGLVTKRRDNAPIVKYVFGNMINRLMHSTNINDTINWLKYILQRIIDGKEHINMFILSKMLNSFYKNPEGQAHKVLADRIGERDPGNKPKANERIPYAFIEVDDKPIHIGYKMITQKVNTGERKMITKKVDTGEFYKNGKPKKPKSVKAREGEFIYKNIKVKGEPKFKKKHILQGERIEHPDFIDKNNIKLDYKFYISNQIMNPVKQLLDITMNPDETTELFSQFIKHY